VVNSLFTVLAKLFYIRGSFSKFRCVRRQWPYDAIFRLVPELETVYLEKLNKAKKDTIYMVYTAKKRK